MLKIEGNHSTEEKHTKSAAHRGHMKKAKTPENCLGHLALAGDGGGMIKTSMKGGIPTGSGEVGARLQKGTVRRREKKRVKRLKSAPSLLN